MAQAPQEYALRINGNPIVTTRPAVRVAGEWFVPLAPVARALGSDLKLDPTAQSFRIVRGDGVTASYDAASGRILQGAVLAAQVANFRQIQLNVGVDNILFPLDGVIALFGVTVREDFDRQILEIESLPSTGASGSAGGFGTSYAYRNFSNGTPFGTLIMWDYRDRNGGGDGA